ncbi:Plant self-incompatibility protein S1 family [Euphorbia peplus]|nr:Plant self-incompatibility protein S1 family [Euphorbia peplus]
MNNTLIIFSLAALILFTTQTHARLPFKSYHIHVVNQLSHGKALFLHCKSKDDDLGAHNLRSNQEFQWSFQPNLFGGTLFWCYLVPDKDNKHAYINAFETEDGNLLSYCDDVINCIWEARDDGVYSKNIPNKTDVKKTGWVKGLLADFRI